MPVTVHDLQTHWQVSLPASCAPLLRLAPTLVLGPYEFLDPEEILKDAERWRGMLPQFLPFGVTEAGLCGFYSHHQSLPVLAWDEETDSYSPLATNLDAFLARCVLEARYEIADEYGQEDPLLIHQEEEIADVAETLGIPVEAAKGPLPRNDRDFHGRLLALDPGCAEALAWQGCAKLSQRSPAEAAAAFERACRAAAWFADPHYLHSVALRRQGRDREAVAAAWQVLQRPISLSTQVERYDLGEGAAEGEIPLAAIADIAAAEELLEPAAQESPLWQLLRSEAPEAYEPAGRLPLAEELARAGDAAGAERELLNALTLSTDAEGRSVAYDRLVAFYEGLGRQRDAALCRRDAALSEE